MNAAQLRAEAARFRGLANGCGDARVADLLRMLADDHETQARGVEPDAEPPVPIAE